MYTRYYYYHHRTECTSHYKHTKVQLATASTTVSDAV